MDNLVINKHQLIGSKVDPLSEGFDIIYGSDENYQFGVGVSAVSLLVNNPSNFFRFHLFLDVVKPDFLDKLRTIAEQFSAEFNVYELDNTLLKTLPASEVWSSAMYFRLIAFEYLSSDYDYALYLDADVVCQNALNLSTDIIKDVIAGVVADEIGVRKKSGARLNVVELSETYFNSGVMFVNLKEWHSHQVTKKCFEFLSLPNAKDLYKYPDQDVLNLILREQLVLLAQRFNTIYTLKNELSDSTHQKYKCVITSDTALIHYTGVTKPWHTWAKYPSAKPFYDALASSPWTENDLKPAIKFAEKKKEYKHLLKQGAFFAGCISGIKYFFQKVRGKKR
ncbi:TPA: glycosyltransferase family 8 protein [Providencia alcalifaciens]|uniref:Glycosyltransferase family 8 n=1 Tax=Providencia alcalifaciens 205/92 TaxID=1256988 RepID=A0AAV3M4U4_9GAMM|nr:glycosyltransferase [Providencia alcalifaciens]EUD10639.1 glycosyltransferase family 8 [Providencia alcalifaciens 205/92]MTC15419.1 lipopolysaccharide 1,2-glucosyltransferase [Providencia alcalifaciens]MTC26530.1 lipopolysaccharide 1,2-glucosyltransferase [Providencia alcalifaciens]MTC62050.1 lipopolysaccharide 1,2-glucosyltransferase [Providencia alcalifaciens]WGZ55630.1 glycosyltransferase [Providencia alcalifaciens]